MRNLYFFYGNRSHARFRNNRYLCDGMPDIVFPNSYLSALCLTFCEREKRDDPSGAARHAQMLRAEGVTVTTRPGGELHVDLEEDGYGWFPRRLPSEGGDGDSGED